MDSGMLDALFGAIVGGVLSLAGSIWVTRYTLSQERINEREKIYQERMEEIQELYTQVKVWEDEEFESWWIHHEHGGFREGNRLECPIERLKMLVSRYEPQLRNGVKELDENIHSIKASDWDMRIDSLPEAEAYNDVEKYHEKFIKQCEEIEASFAVVNDRNVKRYS